MVDVHDIAPIAPVRNLASTLRRREGSRPPLCASMAMLPLASAHASSALRCELLNIIVLRPALTILFARLTTRRLLGIPTGPIIA